jgi:iron complex transport system ATP-binding protein
VLRAETVSCRLGGRLVVDRVTLDVRAGEWLALVGPNGAGKSTLLAALAGVAPVCDGRIALDDLDLAHWPPRERARRIAWLAQAQPVEGELCVRDVVRLGRVPQRGLYEAFDDADDAVVARVLREMAIAPLAGHRIGALSGGERQRALIARALAVEAPTLLLDEPIAHLDAPHQRTLVRGLRARVAAGAAVVTVLHDLTLALLADRIALLVEGRLVVVGTPGDTALHAAIEQAFGHAFEILELAPRAGQPAPSTAADPLRRGTTAPRWVAVALH